MLRWTLGQSGGQLGVRMRRVSPKSHMGGRGRRREAVDDTDLTRESRVTNFLLRYVT